MDDKEFEAVRKQPATIRYEYFIKKVVDYEEVWGLYNDGWATSQDENKSVLIPFFPRKEFAESFARGDRAAYHVRLIELDEFMDKWLPWMKKDGIHVSIFPNEQDTAVVEIEDLIESLERELENY